MGDNRVDPDFVECRNAKGVFDPVTAAYVYDFFRYKLDRYELPVPNNVIEKRSLSTNTAVGDALKSLADEFSSQFKEHFVLMCDQLLNEKNVNLTVEGVGNELFSDGIQWRKIVAFLVFGSELAILCKNRNWHGLISLITSSMLSYISQRLLPWINDHGGWESLIRLLRESKIEQQTEKHNKWHVVLFHPVNLLCLGLSTISAFTLGYIIAQSKVLSKG